METFQKQLTTTFPNFPAVRGTIRSFDVEIITMTSNRSLDARIFSLGP
jgi:hypothetical protein